MSEQTQAMEKTSQDPRGLMELVRGKKFQRAVTEMLPKHLTVERFTRITIQAMTRTPKLLDADRATFVRALMDLSALGLEPDGRRAHLVPFWNSKLNAYEVQLIIDYKGMVDLVMATGKISNIHADAVCENDKFEYDLGIVRRHQIDFRKPRGDMYAVYAVVRFKDGSEKFEVMGKDEVEAVRKRSRAANDGPWLTDYREMSKKTVFRRLTKWVSMSPETRDVIERDDDQYEHKQMKVATPDFTSPTSGGGFLPETTVDVLAPAKAPEPPPQNPPPPPPPAAKPKAKPRGRPPKKAAAAPESPVEAPQAQKQASEGGDTPPASETPSAPDSDAGKATEETELETPQGKLAAWMAEHKFPWAQMEKFGASQPHIIPNIDQKKSCADLMDKEADYLLENLDGLKLHLERL